MITIELFQFFGDEEREKLEGCQIYFPPDAHEVWIGTRGEEVD